MATKARPRKVAGVKKKSAKAAKKSAPKKESSTNGEATETKSTAIKKSRGKADIDPNQKNLPIVEDERIAAIETAVKQYLEKQKQVKALKEECNTLVNKLPVLFKKHTLNKYSCCGHTITVIHGADEVKIKKAKAQ